VAAAIAASGAQSVDTASGVEATRGSKSGSLIRQFVAACDPLLC
jgi:phosphoribosylanthranilate isomerase